MNIQIGKMIEQKHKKVNGNYVINISWMDGDGDRYESLEMRYDVKSEKDMKEFEDTYKCCSAFMELENFWQYEITEKGYDIFFKEILDINKDDDRDIVYELFGDISYSERSDCWFLMDEFEVWYEDELENKFELIIG
jgi:hypothetical protein